LNSSGLVAEDASITKTSLELRLVFKGSLDCVKEKSFIVGFLVVGGRKVDSNLLPVSRYFRGDLGDVQQVIIEGRGLLQISPILL